MRVAKAVRIAEDLGCKLKMGGRSHDTIYHRSFKSGHLAMHNSSRGRATRWMVLNLHKLALSCLRGEEEAPPGTTITVAPK